MIDRILARLGRPLSTGSGAASGTATPMPPEDARHAMGALLVRMAHADRAYLFEEVEQIDRILAAREGCGPLDAARMRARCEKLADALPDTGALVDLIRAAVAEPEREAMFLALWQVMLADGIRDSREEELATEAGGLLGLPPDRVAHLIAADGDPPHPG